MNTDISFVKSERHKKIIEDIIQCFSKDYEVIGLMLIGSHARGDAYINSDLDLLILLKEGLSRSFEASTINDILVEYKYLDINKARKKLEINPMEPYQYLDGRILFDKDGIFQTLVDEALIIYNHYQMDCKERRAIFHWLYSARIKIYSAVQSEDYLKAIFITSTTSYKIIEGIWGICNKPVPPAGSVLPHVDDLIDDIPMIREWIETLFLGTIEERIFKAIEMIDWINNRILNE